MPSPSQIVQTLKRGLDVPQEQAASVANRITPVVNVADLGHWSRNTTQIESPAFGCSSLGVLANNYQMLGIINPTENHSDVLVERVEAYSTAALTAGAEFHCYYITADYGWDDYSGHKAWRDTRRDQNPTFVPSTTFLPTALLGRDQHTSLSALSFLLGRTWMSTINYWPLVWPMNILLQPGWALLYVINEVYQGLSMTFWWKEFQRAR